MNRISRTAFAFIICILLCGSVSRSAENSVTPQDAAMLNEFSGKFDLYWTDSNFIIHRNDQELPTTTVANYSRDSLFTDGNYVESAFHLSTVGGNAFGLSFRGNRYDSYDGKYLLDGDVLYYTRCIKEQFDAALNKNGCIVFALFQNSQEIDVAKFHDSLGFVPLNLSFVTRGRLFYTKKISEKVIATLVFDKKAKTLTSFKSELFDITLPNDLLGILSNGNIVYQTSSSSNDAYYSNVKLFQFDLHSTKPELIIDLGKSLQGAADGAAIGTHYYFRAGSVAPSLIKDDIQIAKLNSKTQGKILDVSKEACSLDATIHTYHTKMICIHPSGVVARIDSSSPEAGQQLGGINNPDTQSELFLDEKPMNLTSIRYLLASEKNTDKELGQISVAFSKEGKVEFVLFWIHGNSPWRDSIYISRYSRDFTLSTPVLLKDGGQLFGVLAK